MKIAILSDWSDWYDHAFASKYACDVVWKRYTRAWTTRENDYEFLIRQGLKVPRHGSPEELKADGVETVVHYIDPYAHAGEGKEVLHIDDAIARSYPKMFCSEYLGERTENARSTRTLAVGYRMFRLAYSSDTWQSNVGDVEIELIEQFDIRGDKPHSDWAIDIAYSRWAYEFHKRSPIWAIDYIGDTVIDWNPSPGTKWAMIDHMMTASEVYKEVCDCWVEVSWSNQILDTPDWRNYTKAMILENSFPD
jgi:hypothetical protein